MSTYDGSFYLIIFLNIVLAVVVYLSISIVLEKLRSTSDFYRQKFRYYRRINFYEFLCLLAACVLVPVVGYETAKGLKFYDKEFISGTIVSKEGPVISRCNCKDVCVSWETDENGKKKCTSTKEECDYPCYSWSLTADYHAVFSDIGLWSFGPYYQPFGANAPDEWERAVVGDAACSIHIYSNTLRASESSTLKPRYSPLSDPLSKQSLIPPRVVDIQFRDLYEGYRAVWTGASAPPLFLGKSSKHSGNSYLLVDVSEWLMLTNQILGPGIEGRIGKQGNLVFYLTDYESSEWADAVYYRHNGGSKNDIQVYIGFNPSGSVRWSEVRYGLEGQDMSEDVGIGSNERLRLYINRYLRELKPPFDMRKVVNDINELALDNFNRKPNKDFAFLVPTVRPSYGSLVLLTIVSVAITCLLSIFFYHRDPFRKD